MPTKQQRNTFMTKAARKDPYALTKNRPEYQLFQSEYFSAADIKIYLGDIWVDDAIMVSYALSEQVMPIFGYNSFTYDAVARGQRTINGMLEMNFKSVGYLQQVLENADAIEFAIQNGQRGKGYGHKFFENTRLDIILETLGKASFDQIANEYEKALWNDTDSDLLSSDSKSYFPNSDYGFDLKIYYGPVQEVNNYGSKSLYKAMESQVSPLTVEIINGVQFNSQSKQIATGNESQPVVESYSFIARDLNGHSMASDKVSEEIANMD